MANELKHKVVGPSLTQAEFEATDGHIFDSQAAGDLVYASSATQLRRLGIGSTDQLLTVASGIPSWAASPVAARAAKAADETVNNSSTLQNDDDLTFSAVANAVYLVSVALLVSGGATPDFKCNLSVPASATRFFAAISNDTALNVVTVIGTTADILHGTSGGGRPAHVWWQVETGATAGSVTLQWAQNVANSSDTKVLTGSSLIAIRTDA